MKNKKELAMFLAVQLMCYDMRLNRHKIIKMLDDYEKNHEGKTILSDKSLKSKP